MLGLLNPEQYPEEAHAIKLFVIGKTLGKSLGEVLQLPDREVSLWWAYLCAEQAAEAEIARKR